jgi:hypothetical protein
MNLEIGSESRFTFEIDYDGIEWLLKAHGGEWFLDNPKDDRAWRNLGSVKRISWLGALKKALEAIGAYDNERDGV